MRYQVTVKGFKSGLNELIAGRMYDHRTKKYRNPIKNKNDALCVKYIKSSRSLRGVKIDRPIIIHYAFYCEDKMHDRMNIASAFIKSFEDALQKCNVRLCSKYGINAASKPTTSAPAKTTVKRNEWIARVQAECNKQGFSNQTVDGIAGKNTLAGCPTMRKGAKGNLTALLQEKLNATGYNCGKIDRIFGTGTENAVKALQKAHGLTQDGIVGQKTWRILLGM